MPINRSSPVILNTNTAPYVAASGVWWRIAAGYSNSLAINLSDSKIYAWGSGFATNALPVAPRSWSKISVGISHTLAIRSDGLLFAWGGNNNGQIGDNTILSKSSPVQIGSSSWSLISAGSSHSVAVDAAGILYAWGGNTNGALGDNTITGKSSPVRVLTNNFPEGNSWIALETAGAGFLTPGTGLTNFALEANGSLFAWGNNSNGELASNNTTSVLRNYPFSWTQIAAHGVWSTYALRSDGGLFGWGSGPGIGDGTTVSKSSPVQIGSESWSFVTTSKRVDGVDVTPFVFAIHSNGALFAWGVNAQGQLGDGTTVVKSSPVKIGSDSWIKVAAGGSHALAINSGGSLYAWGNNALGQLGNTQLDFSMGRSSPTLIAALSANTFLSVNAAANSSYAIRNDGRLFAWGNNAVGQLGLGAVETDLYFDYASGLSWSKIASGNFHYVGLRSDGAVFTGGYNLQGQLGDGTTFNRSSPVKVGSLSYTNVGAGEFHSFAIAANGALYAWGFGTSGQIGDAGGVSRSSPVKVGSDSWVSVAGGQGHSVGANSTGRLFTWGDNSFGAAGRNLVIANTVTIPTEIYNHDNVNLHSFTQVDSGIHHCVALSTNNKLFLWGNDNSGQLGSLRIATVQDPRSWTTLSTGSSFTLAIASNGALHAWGYSLTGELGDGTTVPKSSPVQIGTNSWLVVAATGVGGAHAIVANGALFGWGSNTTNGLSTTSRSSPVQIGTSSWAYVTGGREHVAAITSDGKLFTWGVDRDGRLGDWDPANNNLVDRSSPVQVATGISFTTVAVGGSHSLAIASNGALYAWGLSASGQLGIGTTTQQVDSQTAMSWTSLAFGSSASYGITSNGALYAWGLNENGQIGDGTTVLKYSPVKVGSDSWTSIAAGYRYCLGLVANGALYAWGNNVRGQLGDGTTVDKSTPVKIGAESWTKIFTSDNGYQSAAVGGFTSYGIHSNGALFVWGLNNVGQLGDGTTISKSSPVKIGADSWTMIGPGGFINTVLTAGAEHPFATGIVSNGALYAWGNNQRGQLGDGTTISKSSPVKIGAQSWTAVSSGDTHAVALHSNGSVFAWGNNAFGQLGDASVIGKSSPVKVSTTLSFTTISAENFATHALHSNGALYGWGLGSSVGDGTTVNKNTPVKIGASSWTFVTGGGAIVGGLLSSTSDFYLWANIGQQSMSPNPYFFNYGGSIAAAYNILSSPVAVTTGFTNTYVLQPRKVGSDSWSAVAAGDNYSLGITSNGALYAWGLNTSGMIGDGTVVSKSSPIKIGSNSWASVAASASTSYARLANGQLMAWGINTSGALGGGQIGDNTVVSKSSPVFVSTTYSGTSWNLVSANPAGTHAAGIIANNNLLMWGSAVNIPVGANVFAEPGSAGSFGPLTFGQKAFSLNYSGVARKLDDNSWIQIGVNKGNTTGGILSNGALYAWGNNAFGQIGDGTTVPKSSPVKIGASSWSLISVGKTLSFGVASNGALFAWGAGQSGQLGDGNFANRSSPVHVYISGSVATPGSWTAINALGNGGQGITGNVFYAWGTNSLGEAGRIINAATVFAPSQVGAASIKLSPTSVGSSSWSMIDAGGTGYTLGIVSNGALYAWGLNSSGTLGNGTTINQSSPIQIGTDSWSSVSAGLSTAAGITTNGRGFVWGNNQNGLFGGGGVVALLDGVDSVPTSPLDFAMAYDNGSNFPAAYITANGALYPWGGTPNGQIGDGTTINKSSPVQLGTLSWSQIALSDYHSLAIASNGALYAWGNNAFGQIGDGTTVPKSSPVKIGAQSWSQIRAGTSWSIAVHSNGALYAWGLNSLGQLGDGTTVPKSSPVKIGADSWSQIATGMSQATTFGIVSNGALYAWGDSSFYGLLGDGTTVSKSSPVKIGSNSWAFLAANPYRTMHAILANGNMMGWGSDAIPYIGGAADGVSRSSPVHVGTTVGLSTVSWTFVSGGFDQRHAIASNGALYSWGGNTGGALGDGSTTNRITLQKIGNSSWTKVYAGRFNSMGTYANGALYLWGNLVSIYKANNNVTTPARSSPVVLGAESPFSRRPGVIGLSPVSFAMLSVGVSHMGGVFSNSRLMTWGRNPLGVLGDGTTIDRFSPAVAGNTTTFTTWPQKFSDLSYTKIGVGGATAAIAANGALYTWGVNSTGTVGDGTTINRSSPVKIGALSWTQITTALGIVANGALYSWGGGALVGDGTTISKSSPIQIGSSSWTFVSAGDSKYAIDINGRLFGWGTNSVSGRLGDGTTTGKSSPVLLGEHGFTYAFNNSEHSGAIKHNTDLFMWGDNGFFGTGQGKLGDGTTISRSSPVFLEVGRFITGGNTYTLSPTLVGSAATYSDVATGNNYYLATVKGSGIIHTWGLNGLTGSGQANKMGYPASFLSVPTAIGANIIAANVSAGNTHSGAIRK